VAALEDPGTGEIDYRTSVDEIDVDALAGFFVGWPSPPSRERHLELLRRSTHVVVALDEARVVGFVTAISDGVMSAYIPLLEVLPEYQRSGVGSELVRRVLAQLGELYMVDLACDEDLVPFYERLGLVRVGAAMGIRNRDALRR
jgi:ribosomal protein S18 acetylase RimI-like enzyme